jgi:hypothetical protein
VQTIVCLVCFLMKRFSNGWEVVSARLL